MANQHDWDTTPEGEGVGLCWEPDRCLSPEETIDRLNAAIERYEETLRVMNDALKEANRIFGNIGNSQVIQRLCPDFAEVAEKVRKAHDPHA